MIIPAIYSAPFHRARYRRSIVAMEGTRDLAPISDAVLVAIDDWRQ
jgi:hypothetical protein